VLRERALTAPENVVPGDATCVENVEVPGTVCASVIAAPHSAVPLIVSWTTSRLSV